MGVWYDSCKRRGCPQCLAYSTEVWLTRQQERLLAETHHHWVFTIPDELLDIWRFNRRLMQDLRFSVVADTLKLLSKDKKYLVAQPAFILSLHTWGRNLVLHPHIHCLIACGGLNGAGQWVTPTRKVLFPAQVLMQLFRGKLISAMRAAKDLVLPIQVTKLAFKALLNTLRRAAWVVHCCEPYAHGKGVLSYLARYVKSGAFKNSQLRAVHEGRVHFGYQSHQTGQRAKIRLTINDFLMRVCDHIPQKGKPSLRYYGLYHPCSEARLNIARQRLGQASVSEVAVPTWRVFMGRLNAVPRCATCDAPLQRQEKVALEKTVG